jgi:hypothetical protein
MLKTYKTLDEVPEALREHYRKQDGVYVPVLDDDHPVLVHNKTLLSEKSQATAKVKELEADIEEAKKTTVPRGHVTVAKADADLLNNYKALGTVDEVKAKVTEHATLKESEAKRQREDQLVNVAKVLGYDNVEAFKRLPNLPEFEIRGEGDKQKVIAKLKEGDKVVEKDAKPYLESSPDIAPFLSALKTGGVTVHGSRSGDAKPPANVFDKIRKDVQAKQTEMPVHPMFNRIAGRGAPAQGE